MRNKTFLLMLAVLYMTIAFMLSCTKSTEPNTGLLSGSITLVNDMNDPLLDPADFSGVTVALYSLAALDTTIVRINQLHPNIGVQINQETEFDHRLQSPISVTTTNSNGTFTTKKIPYGEYNLVVFKSGWSVKYLYNIVINKSKTTLTGGVELNPARELSGFIYEPYTFSSGKTYIVSETVSFTAPVTIHTGAQIFVESGGVVNFFDDMNVVIDASSDYWKIDTSYNLYTTTLTSIGVEEYFSNITCGASDSRFSNALVRHIGDGIAFSTDAGSLFNVDVKNYKSGLTFNNVSGTVEHSNFRVGSQKGIQGLSLADSLTVSNCIIYKNLDGIIAYTGGVFTISNTYLYCNQNALRPQSCTGIITNNNFDRNVFDIWQSLASSTIAKNNFYNAEYNCIMPQYFALVRDNNFYRSRYFIMIRGDTGSSSFVDADLDATYNYWAANDIDTHLLDSGDNADFPHSECPYRVIYLPKRNSKVIDAGIQP